MTINELSEMANCSKSWVYRVAKQLGRLPTLAELVEKKGKRGRPKKYKERNNEV